MQRVSIAATSKQLDPSENLIATEKSLDNDDGDGNENDDYSASISAIMQRRNSTRRQSRRKRRPSSPFGPEVDGVTRRRSSAYTTSSGDTIISMEECGNQEQIFENLKLHKEVLTGIKQQPWALRRKIKLVRQAKAYVRRHEGVLQERLAQSRSTRNVIARISFFMNKKWQYFRREFVNFRMWLIPWEVRIMEIESHFGSAVASYFTFLRWLFWINLVIAITVTTFVVIPEVLTANESLSGERKIMLKDESIKSKHLRTLWEFEGILKYSPFFYGWYTNQDSHSNYKLPLAYFVTNLVVYTYSFVAILRKMAENSRLSKLTEKENEYLFSWKLFTGWDFMIGNPETAHNRMGSLVLGFKEALLEEKEKEKDERNWRIILMRIFVNIVVLSLLALSAYLVFELGRRTNELENESFSWWQNVPLVMSLITNCLPLLFEILGFLESYHPRKQLRIQLARIMVTNLLSLYSLIIGLFSKISRMQQDIYNLKPTNTNCKYKIIPCGNEITRKQQLATLTSLGLVLISNITHSHVKREMPQSIIPYATQKYYLNPLYPYNDTMYDDFNDASDDNYDDNYSDKYHDIAKEINVYNNDGKSILDTNRSIDTKTIIKNLHTSTLSFQYVTPSTIMESSMIENESSIVTDKISFTEEPTFATSPQVNEELTSDITSTLIPSNISDSTKSNGRVISSSGQNYTVTCVEKTCTTTLPRNLAVSLKTLNPKDRRKLRHSCWETKFGQELAKVTVMDLVVTISFTLGMDFFRAVFVRFMNNCWCWDLEKQFPQYGDFKIAENILALVYNQGMVWMGMFFSPGLTALNIIKLGILMYLRSWAVLTCNVPHEVVFKASRSNNFYYTLLLTMLFLCVLPVGYAIVWVEPSWHCGPFSGYPKMYNLVTQTLIDLFPETIQRVFDYIASPGIIIPLILLMTLVIYYMVSLTGSLREANNDLKTQLKRERTEERRKLFKIVERRQNGTDTAFAKWKKLLPALPRGKSENTSQNMRILQKDDVQITMGLNDTNENKQSMINDEHDSLRDQILSNDEKQYKNEDDSESHNASSDKKPISLVGSSSESQSSGHGVIPEIQLNNTCVIHPSTEINDMPDDHDKKVI